MSALDKLKLPEKETLIMNAPNSVNVQPYKTTAGPRKYQSVVIFCKNTEELKIYGPDGWKKVSEGGTFWVAYPRKSGGITSDLSRDGSWASLDALGLRPVSQRSVNDDWTALRWKPFTSVQSKSTGPTSNEAVKTKTGKTWPEWFRILDEVGARDMTHPEIAKYLHGKEKITSWWSQMVTNAYEQHIGRRKPHEMKEGFEVSASKTIYSNTSDVYSAFKDPAIRNKWLDHDLEITTDHKNRSLRAKWDNTTRICVDIYDKGQQKTQVVVQHIKLPDADSAAEQKSFWREKVETLKLLLEA